ncbi:hypothetical protein D6D08_01120 [Aureobasidium pullulans]|nr:hypothetical protein D6D08_01120 [Aureobasidium pullulans]
MFRLPFKVPFSTSYPVYLLELIIGILWYSFRFRHRHYHPPTRERDIRVVWFYLRIISKNIQYRYQILLYRFRKMQYRFRILLHRFQILLDDMWTVMFLAMVVDLMTNIWDMWYIGRSHLLTQGISHVMLSYRILAMLLLSELVQEALFSPHEAYWIILLCYLPVVVYSIATESWYSYFMRFVYKVWNHNFFGRVILICRSAHVWRDIAAIILFDASKGLFLTAITFVPIKCLYELFFHTLRSETHQGVDSHTVCFGALC